MLVDKTLLKVSLKWWFSVRCKLRGTKVDLLTKASVEQALLLLSKDRFCLRFEQRAVKTIGVSISSGNSPKVVSYLKWLPQNE